MKKNFLAAIMLFAVALVVTSCYSSRSKQGCPANFQTSNKPFRA